MLQSFFTGLSGMFSFSKSLDNTSNNVANMNTPGYRGSDSFLRSVNNGSGQGFGTNLEGTSLRTNSGEIRQTGNDTDLAISGKGFFVLRDTDGELHYTRAGQFRFDEDNQLIDSVTEMHVQAINDAGHLERIDITQQRVQPPEPTTAINFSGNLSNADTDHVIQNVVVFDANGESHDLTIEFTNNSATTADSWTVDVKLADTTLDTGEIRFNASDLPLTDFNTFDADLALGGATQTISFNFGEPDQTGGATQFSGGDSTLGSNVEDGHSVLGLSSLNFKEDGTLEFTYSNGDTAEGQQIALANFSDESKLSNSSGSLYRSTDSMPASFGQANEGGFGTIQGGSIELSNVDLTQEFADILIVQRGYQASSQIMSVANELIEQLYNRTR